MTFRLRVKLPAFANASADRRGLGVGWLGLSSSQGVSSPPLTRSKTDDLVENWPDIIETAQSVTLSSRLSMNVDSLTTAGER